MFSEEKTAIQMVPDDICGRVHSHMVAEELTG